jgi:hypothetical protein
MTTVAIAAPAASAPKQTEKIGQPFDAEWCAAHSKYAGGMNLAECQMNGQTWPTIALDRQSAKQIVSKQALLYGESISMN